MTTENEDRLEDIILRLGKVGSHFTSEDLYYLLDVIGKLRGQLAEAEERADKVKFNAKLLEALAFYADPKSYFAIGFLPDPPNGEFMDDFSVTELGPKPGKLARQVLEWDKP